ncbi:CAF17-like 4Fe-4S cluster assembly/insertion protein YgfZ [Roseateles amylovorans]|uniref:Folate-binding protein n=1 Tax=Roseateles amylovorans TaxID=2978473 RepID=A0ABY6AV47_9BURK|nr:folate-binding protein [Roseateles amylovorans]UXH76732.1 folate-binding protein [Roseateles amylovorans]
MTEISRQDSQPSSHPSAAPSVGAVRLSDWGVMRAQGEEAAKFLHSQLTQDLALQTTSQARLAGYCSPKGRLLATMVAVKPDDQTVLMALPADVLPATLKRLSMFVMRAKCKLTDASADWAVWGLAGEPAAQWLQARLGEAPPAAVWTVGRAEVDGAQVLVTRLPDDGTGPRFLMLQPAVAPAPTLPALAEAEWQGLDVRAGLAWVRQATVEQFVPQMLNLELIGGVNFQKGCYPGQEIVARSQYRGTIKRRTQAFALADGTVAQLGQEIFHSEDPEQPAGMVAALGEQAGHPLVLAEVKLAALEAGSLHLGSAAGPVLTPRALPYTIGEPQ